MLQLWLLCRYRIDCLPARCCILGRRCLYDQPDVHPNFLHALTSFLIPSCCPPGDSREAAAAILVLRFLSFVDAPLDERDLEDVGVAGA
jgi:hypothetical protein